MTGVYITLFLKPREGGDRSRLVCRLCGAEIDDAEVTGPHGYAVLAKVRERARRDHDRVCVPKKELPIV